MNFKNTLLLVLPLSGYRCHCHDSPSRVSAEPPVEQLSGREATAAILQSGTVYWIPADGDDSQSPDQLKATVLAHIASDQEAIHYAINAGQVSQFELELSVNGDKRRLPVRQGYDAGAATPKTLVLLDTLLTFSLNWRKGKDHPPFQDPGTYFSWGIGDHAMVELAQLPDQRMGNEYAALTIALVDYESTGNAARTKGYLVSKDQGNWDYDFDTIEEGHWPSDENSSDIYRILVPGPEMISKTDGRNLDSRGIRFLLPTEASKSPSPLVLHYRSSLGFELPGTLEPSDTAAVVVARSYFDASGDGRKRKTPDILAMFLVPDARERLLQENAVIALCAGFSNSASKSDNKGPKFVVVLRGARL